MLPVSARRMSQIRYHRLENMRTLKLLAFLTLISACQIKSEIDRAHEIVNKGLKEVELEEARTSQIKPTNKDSLVNDLLQRIKNSQTDNIYNMSINALKVCKKIEMKTDSLTRQIVNAHTTDENGQINDRHNHNHVNRIMIQQNEGQELHKMLKQASTILTIAARSLKLDHRHVVQITTGNQDIPSNSSWWEYNFSEMPGLAALPILRKINNDAYKTKIRFLEGVAQMNR